MQFLATSKFISLPLPITMCESSILDHSPVETLIFVYVEPHRFHFLHLQLWWLEVYLTTMPVTPTIVNMVTIQCLSKWSWEFVCGGFWGGGVWIVKGRETEASKVC